ncbi:hypothetical protein ACNJ7E_32225 [Rhodococcus sp. NM-2]|uniref:hypothetical protein n=1 Tax=Rhodococcus TaxID=1827 RepID=UPI00247408A4|nr:hypothetical protein [Rhodococcus opacus]MDH6291004.1 hypothetical protein [Rhodococcus opacus]
MIATAGPSTANSRWLSAHRTRPTALRDHRLAALRGFLVVEPECGGDRVGRRGDAQHGEREGDEDVFHGCISAEAGEDVVDRPAVAELDAEPVSGAAEQQSVQEQGDGPREQCPAVHPPRQTDGPRESRPGGLVAGAFGDETATDIAAAEQHVGGDGRCRGPCHMQEKCPPALLGERAQLQRPALR